MSTFALPLEVPTITLMRADVPIISNMNRLLPARTCNGGTFRIVAGRVPGSEAEMSALLRGAIPGSWLVKYDPRSATGFFRMLDREAPRSGTMLQLIKRA